MSSGASTAFLIGEYNRGCDLRDAGRLDDAFGVWAELVRSAGDGLSEDAQLVVARALDAAAHLLREAGRETEAADRAMQAVVLARPLGGEDAQLVFCRATKTQLLALRSLGRDGEARQIETDLIERSSASDIFELRVFLAYARRYRLWEHKQHQDLAAAVASARHVTDLLGQESYPDHLIEAGELILSSAEILHAHPIGRRVPAAISDQAELMFTVVDEMAATAGGEIGAAVALSATLARANAHARNYHLRTAYRDHLGQPAVTDSGLAALEQVQEAARTSGAEDRHLQLALERAAVLHAAGRTSDAATLFEELLRQTQTKRSLSARGDAALIRATRKILAI